MLDLNRVLVFDVAVNKTDTFTIPFKHLEKIISDNNLDIDVNNLTNADIEVIYCYTDLSYITEEDIVESQVKDNFEVIEQPEIDREAFPFNKDNTYFQLIQEVCETRTISPDEYKRIQDEEIPELSGKDIRDLTFEEALDVTHYLDLCSETVMKTKTISLRCQTNPYRAITAQVYK